MNYERKSRYVLTIRAEDCASDTGDEESRFDTTELTISITDINDSSPTFLDSPYLAHVMENVIPPNGGYVITVKAYDADTPPFNSQVRYFLKEGDADLFRINASTGEISLLRALDRELQSEYTLTLVGMDTGKCNSFNQLASVHPIDGHLLWPLHLNDPIHSQVDAVCVFIKINSHLNPYFLSRSKRCHALNFDALSASLHDTTINRIPFGWKLC